MPHIIIASIFACLPILIIQYLGKFLIALYIEPLSVKNRLRCATLSTIGCTLATPIGAALITVISPSLIEFHWTLSVIVLCLPSVVIDILLLAKYRRGSVKIAFLYLVVDFFVAVFSTAAVSFMDLD